ncbi:MAG: hypothetical protein IPG75_10015 [Gemmatimonadetes bacterium]|nr:hypothetical protein [Gemmatimonadota bacterium]
MLVEHEDAVVPRVGQVYVAGSVYGEILGRSNLTICWPHECVGGGQKGGRRINGRRLPAASGEGDGCDQK